MGLRRGRRRASCLAALLALALAAAVPRSAVGSGSSTLSVPVTMKDVVVTGAHVATLCFGPCTLLSTTRHPAISCPAVCATRTSHPVARCSPPFALALPTGDDVYMACSTALPKEAAHIVRFEPQADMAVVHHMLLYLCPSEPLVRPHDASPRSAVK